MGDSFKAISEDLEAEREEARKRPSPPAAPPPPPCDHKWIFAGTVYSSAGMNSPGRNYEDRYFCERCLEQKYLNLRNFGNKYDEPLTGTLPK